MWSTPRSRHAGTGALDHERTGRRQVAPGQRLGRRPAPCRTRCARAEPVLAPRHPRSPRCPASMRSAAADQVLGPLALRAALRVGRADQLTLLAGVQHPDRRTVGHRHLRHRQRGAVDQQRCTCTPAALASWSMIPHGTGRRLLRQLAALRDLQRCAGVAQCECRGDLQRCTRGQPAAERQVRGHGADQATQDRVPVGAPHTPELVGDPGHVAAPRRLHDAGSVTGRTRLHQAVDAVGAQPDDPVVDRALDWWCPSAPPWAGPAHPCSRCGHDQVDPSGCVRPDPLCLHRRSAALW